MACQNIMLVAESLGLGSCWVKFGSLVTDNPEIVERLELKKDESIFGPSLLGYARESPQPPAKKPPVVKWI
jgi:nitroreductase